MLKRKAPPIAFSVPTRVIAIVAAELDLMPQQIQPSDTFDDDLCADAADRINIALELQKEFAVAIGGEGYGKAGTVADLITLVEHLTESA